MIERPIIAVDFDATLATHAFPEIGREVDMAMFWLRRWKRADVRLILFTCRGGRHLTNAVEWCLNYGVTFDAVNCSTMETVAANDRGFMVGGGLTDGADWSIKPFYNLLIDDRNAGIALDAEGNVDWTEVGPWVTNWLIERGVDFNRDSN